MCPIAAESKKSNTTSKKKLNNANNLGKEVESQKNTEEPKAETNLISGEYNMLFICEKSGQNDDKANRNKIETKIFANKFNQLSNTFLTNLRKNANIKFFTK